MGFVKFEGKEQEYIKLVRAQEFMEALSIGKTTFYGQIKAGLIPQPVRSVTGKTHWGDYEVDMITKARMKNISIQEQKELSLTIENKRNDIKIAS